MHQWLGCEMMQQLVRRPVSVQIHVQEVGASTGGRPAAVPAPHADRPWAPAPDTETARCGSLPSGLVVPGMPVTGSFLVPWQNVQRSNGVPIPRIDIASALCRFKFKGVSAKHGEIVRMAVVALTGVVLGKEPAEGR